MYLYNDIALSIVGDLNSRILNLSFSKLVENDKSVLPINNYIPKIWENKWFNDNTLAGYFKGDAVWKYTMTLDEFLALYNGIIYDYAKDNPILNGYLRYERGQYNIAEEKSRYLNIISGYGVAEPKLDDKGDVIHDEYGNVETYWDQKLPPLFDYGPLITSKTPPIQIYVSLIDNNKEFLSNSLAWTNIVLSDDNAFNNYISTEISILMDDHIKNYHLDGIKTYSDFSEILLKRDFSNFDVSALYNALLMVNHNTYINDLGFDYVREFKKESSTTLLGKSCILYKWCRLWNSGHLEHGGIIEIPTYDMISSSNASCYTMSVDFTWANSDNLYYDYDSGANFYGNTVNNLYFANGVLIENYNLSDALNFNNRYTVSLTPVQFNNNDIDINKGTIQLKSEDYIAKYSYPSNANNNLNKTYVNFETHSMTNKSFCITRSRTDDLRNNDTIRYVQYYVSGYRSSIDKIYNILSCHIVNLYDSYTYTGEEIKPSFDLYTNNNEVLTLNVDYKVIYDNNIEPTNDARIEIVGINPYYGILTTKFSIKYELAPPRYEISNINSSYPFI